MSILTIAPPYYGFQYEMLLSIIFITLLEVQIFLNYKKGLLYGLIICVPVYIIILKTCWQGNVILTFKDMMDNLAVVFWMLLSFPIVYIFQIVHVSVRHLKKHFRG